MWLGRAEVRELAFHMGVLLGVTSLLTSGCAWVPCGRSVLLALGAWDSALSSCCLRAWGRNMMLGF